MLSSRTPDLYRIFLIGNVCKLQTRRNTTIEKQKMLARAGRPAYYSPVKCLARPMASEGATAESILTRGRAHRVETAHAGAALQQAGPVSACVVGGMLQQKGGRAGEAKGQSS